MSEIYCYDEKEKEKEKEEDEKYELEDFYLNNYKYEFRFVNERGLENYISLPSIPEQEQEKELTKEQQGQLLIILLLLTFMIIAFIKIIENLQK